MDQLYLSTEGIFGSTLGVSAAYVMMFVLFGAFMERTGTGQLFMDFALSLTGHTAGGPGKVSVVSSSLFGTISGSAVANVMVDGPMTIPLMKRTGFRPHFAAAVEATASTGGQIMPPIMGAAAFVMAEFLAVPYFQVTIWAVIPAILYYVAVFFAVHFEAKRHGLLGVPRAELPRLGSVMRERGHLFLPILIVLVGMYCRLQRAAGALLATLACLPVALLRKSTREGTSRWRTSSTRSSTARRTRSGRHRLRLRRHHHRLHHDHRPRHRVHAIGRGAGAEHAVRRAAAHRCRGIVLGLGLPTTPSYILHGGAAGAGA